MLRLEDVDREGHCHGDDKRHTFGDADNKKSDGCGSEIDSTSDRRTFDELVVTAHHKEEPDDSKEDESDTCDRVSIVADDFSKNLEFLLENSDLLLDLERILVSIFCRSDLLFLEGVLANAENESLTSTTHDNGVLEEDVVWVVLLVLLGILVGALFDSVVSTNDVWENLNLVNVHIHLLDKEAVSWDAVTLVKENDVTDDEVFDIDSLGGAILATQDSDFLVHDFGLETQELLLFAPVTESLNHSGKEDSEVDGDGFEPLLVVSTVL